MQDEQKTREMVKRAYARAVTSPSRGSCCGGSEPKGVVARLAGYTPEELAAIPADSAENAFGCGNPLALAGVREGDVVLDLGSGAGIDIILAGQRVGPGGRVIGVDMTDEMIARARDNIHAAGLTNVEVRKGIIEDLPLQDASVDWVISNCVINLSPEKGLVFSEIARVLRPGGQMLVSDIVARDLPGWILTSAALYASCVAGAIDEEAYLQGLREAGLTDVQVRARLVYDIDQLRALVVSEIGDQAGAVPCCGPGPVRGGADVEALVERVAPALADRIWSARFYARKPAA